MNADSHAAFPSGPAQYYLTENAFGPALRCPRCTAFLWKDGEGHFLPCSCPTTGIHTHPIAGTPLRVSYTPSSGTSWRHQCEYNRSACTVCDTPPSYLFEVGDDFTESPLISVWYDNKSDTVCRKCLTWAMTQFKTVKLQRRYT